MAWASTDLVPSSINLTPVWSENAAGFLNDLHVTLTARKSDGSAFDFTAAATVNVNISSGIAQSPFEQTTTTASTTGVVGSATNLKFTITKAQLGNLGAKGTKSPAISITASDGTTTLMVASGQAGVVVAP